MTDENISTEIGEVVADIIEETEEQKAEARALAAQIAEAALEGERGRRIETLEREFSEWRLTLDQLPTTLGTQMAAMLETTAETLRSEMAALIASSAVAVVLESPPQPDQTLLIPAVSEVLPEATQAPTPEPLLENQPAAPEPKKKRHRFL